MMMQRAIFMSRNGLPTALSATDVGTIGGVEDKILPKLKHADQFGVLY
jgi:hypothetical protein